MTGDIETESFRELVAKHIVRMPAIAVYADPDDYPGRCVARLWEASDSTPTQYVMLAGSADELRERIKRDVPDMQPFAAGADDSPKLLEVYL